MEISLTHNHMPTTTATTPSTDTAQYIALKSEFLELLIESAGILQGRDGDPDEPECRELAEELAEIAIEIIRK